MEQLGAGGGPLSGPAVILHQSAQWFFCFKSVIFKQRTMVMRVLKVLAAGLAWLASDMSLALETLLSLKHMYVTLRILPLIPTTPYNLTLLLELP